MKIIIDSREKKCDHIKAWFENNGIEYEIRKLDEGDYQIEGQPKITVDRKKDMQERREQFKQFVEKEKAKKKL